MGVNRHAPIVDIPPYSGGGDGGVHYRGAVTVVLLKNENWDLLRKISSRPAATERRPHLPGKEGMSEDDPRQRVRTRRPGPAALLVWVSFLAAAGRPGRSCRFRGEGAAPRLRHGKGPPLTDGSKDSLASAKHWKPLRWRCMTRAHKRRSFHVSQVNSFNKFRGDEPCV